jgi:hypothetical protein
MHLFENGGSRCNLSFTVDVMILPILRQRIFIENVIVLMLYAFRSINVILLKS